MKTIALAAALVAATPALAEEHTVYESSRVIVVLHTGQIDGCEIAVARMVMVRGAARHWPGAIQSGWGTPSSLPEADRRGIDFLAELSILTRNQAEAWVESCLEQAARPVAAE